MSNAKTRVSRSKVNPSIHGYHGFCLNFASPHAAAVRDSRPRAHCPPSPPILPVVSAILRTSEERRAHRCSQLRPPPASSLPLSVLAAQKRTRAAADNRLPNARVASAAPKRKNKGNADSNQENLSQRPYAFCASPMLVRLVKLGDVRKTRQRAVKGTCIARTRKSQTAGILWYTEKTDRLMFKDRRKIKIHLGLACLL
ncbi:hypothetical protein EJ06DRAFT_311610 [Trichodelitschia bisporula]|uniref:Uncharacterized protein n=1 Tax=Trichodelitschia bisporula TaxID=703511 RepID=A0A6G1I4F8_9PEZI|nr:hypothetical protein EJ06DRAFT_311610 [Trichodelitschia bisporula]